MTDEVLILRTEDQIEKYLKEKGLFPKSAKLIIEDLRKIKESAEGFVNMIFRIRGSNGHSVVMKQVLDVPISRTDDVNGKGADEHLKEWSLNPNRMRYEIAALIFWNEIKPGICPEIYLLDQPNGIIVMEDLTDLRLLRYEFTRMTKYPNLGKQLGSFFAHNLFDSSDINMTKYRRENLLEFFDNPEYDALYPFLFEECTIVSPHRTTPKETMEIRQSILGDSDVQKEIRRLADQFKNNKECLIHTDLHAANIMIDDNHTKIIDAEFAGFGPIAEDFGRLTASFVLNYYSWLGEDGEHSIEVKRDYQAYIINMINDIYLTFDSEFRKLVKENSAINYNLKLLDVDNYLLDHFTDALSYTAVNAASRIGDRGLVHDFERLSLEERIYPQKLIFIFCKEILGKKIKPKNEKEFTDYMIELPRRFPRNKI